MKNNAQLQLNFSKQDSFKMKSLTPLFASALSMAAIISSCGSGAFSREGPNTGITVSEQMTQDLGTPLLQSVENHTGGLSIIVLNKNEFGASGQVTGAQLRQYLQDRDLDTPYLTDQGADDIADALQTDQMAALKAINKNTNETVLCVVSVGQLNRSLTNHISELSSIPEDLVENAVGTPSQWQTAKLMHEFMHCAQPYQKRSMLDFDITAGLEIDADQKMFSYMQDIYGGNIRDFLKGYRAARAVASVHYTSVTHHTHTDLLVEGEAELPHQATPKLIVQQSNGIRNALAEKVGRLTERSDLLIQAVREQIAFEEQWSVHNPILKTQPDILQRAAHMRPADFFATYANPDDDNRFIRGIQNHLATLIKAEQNNPDTYRVFYQAAVELLEDGHFRDNTYATHFLQTYVDGITLLMPTVANPNIRVPMATATASQLSRPSA